MFNKPFFKKHQFLILLITILLFFFAEALMGERSFRFVVDILLTALVILSFYMIETRTKATLALTLLLGISIALINWMSHIFHVDRPVFVVQSTFGIMFFSILFARTFLSVWHKKKITADVLYGAVCSYLLIGLIWAYAYALVALFQPHAFFYELSKYHVYLFEFNNFIYYSYTTLSSLGFGDILPITGVAKMLTWMESIIGGLYLTILIAQLVSMHLAQKRMLNKVVDLYLKKTEDQESAKDQKEKK